MPTHFTPNFNSLSLGIRGREAPLRDWTPMAGNRAVFSRYRVLILFFVADIVNRSPVEETPVTSFQATKGRARSIR